MSNKYYYDKIKAGLIDPPEDTNEVLEEQQRIWYYVPLVRSIATGYARHCNLDYDDLCQQGYVILASLTTKIDWHQETARITKYINVTLLGLMKNYIARYNGVVSLPRLDKFYSGINTTPVTVESMDDFAAEEPCAEEELLLKERKLQVQRAVTVVVPTLNEREHLILFSCLLSDEPMGYREVAQRFQVGKSSIGRDVDRLTTRLKEVINEYLET